MKFFHSQMPNSPVLNGTAGSMIGLLDACLRDGFGLKSMTTGTIAGGVATINVSGSHSAVVGSDILVAGATPSSLNGEKTVTGITATSVSFATTEPNGSITGTVSFRQAPLGWTKPHSATNLAAYRPSVPEATGCLLRVDDTAATIARVVGYESMTDVNTGMGLFPTAAQISGGMAWPKSNTADATARPWAIFGDGQFFAIYVSPHPSWQQHGVLLGFGDLISYKSGDAYGCVLFGGGTDVTSTGSPVGGDLGYTHATSAPTQGYVARLSTGIGGSQLAAKHSSFAMQAGWSGNSGLNGLFTFPNVPDNGLLLSPVEVRTGNGLRGRIPGVFHSPQGLADAFSFLDRVNGTGQFAGRTFIALRTGTPASSSFGTTFIDITGPWR